MPPATPASNRVAPEAEEVATAQSVGSEAAAPASATLAGSEAGGAGTSVAASDVCSPPQGSTPEGVVLAGLGSQGLASQVVTPQVLNPQPGSLTGEESNGAAAYAATALAPQPSMSAALAAAEEVPPRPVSPPAAFEGALEEVAEGPPLRPVSPAAAWRLQQAAVQQPPEEAAETASVVRGMKSTVSRFKALFEKSRAARWANTLNTQCQVSYVQEKMSRNMLLSSA